MALTANIRDRRCRHQGNSSFPVPESHAGSSSNRGEARRGPSALDEISATDFRIRPPDRTVRAGLNSRVEPVSTMVPFTLNAVSSLAQVSVTKGKRTGSDVFNLEEEPR